MATAIEERTVSQLWKNYGITGDIALRNEIVLKYTWLVKSIVHRVSSISGSYAESEDLQSYGMIGLIKAVEKYDIEKGVSFETFASYRIRGEIIDYLRRNDWVPRSVRKKAVTVESATNALTYELGRQPTEPEVAKRLGISVNELLKTVSDISRFSVVSFEELLYDSIQVGNEYADTETPDGSIAESEMLQVLTGAVDALPEREKLVVTLYYYEELTLKEISEVLGVSESRVSQIHSRAIEKMKKTLQDYING